jgi:hypothetical protein
MDNLGSHKGKAGAPAYPLDEQPTNIRGIWCRCLSRILVGWQFG